MLATLERRRFPAERVLALASARSAGQKLDFQGKKLTVAALEPSSFEGVNVALFSAGATVSKEFAPIAAERGAVVIDNSSAWRMDPEVPLVVPEVNVARAAHTTVVVSAPGLGDDIQAIKAGILEIADVHVVSKCDRPEADRTIADLKNMLMLGLAVSRKPGWQVPVLGVTAVRDEGIEPLLAAIDAHRASLEATGEIAKRRRDIAERRLLRAGEDILRDRFARERDRRMGTLIDELVARKRSPRSAALELIQVTGENA